MKKKLLILAGILVFFQFGFSSNCVSPNYELKDKTIIYNNGVEKVTMRNVDAETFEHLDGYFGRDKNHVYYIGKILGNIDVKTFETVDKVTPSLSKKECPSSLIMEFKDKNGTYGLSDIWSGELKLEE